MISLRHLVGASICALALSGSASAQLPKARQHRIVIGNIHLRPSSIDAQKKFWVDTLGAQPRNVANIYSAMFPDGFVELGAPLVGCPPDRRGLYRHRLSARHIQWPDGADETIDYAQIENMARVRVVVS